MTSFELRNEPVLQSDGEGSSREKKRHREEITYMSCCVQFDLVGEKEEENGTGKKRKRKIGTKYSQRYTLSTIAFSLPSNDADAHEGEGGSGWREQNTEYGIQRKE